MGSFCEQGPLKLRKRLRAEFAAKNVEFTRDFFNG